MRALSAGRPGAGKTSIGDALAERRGFSHLALGRMLRDPNILAEIGINPRAWARAVASGHTIDDDRLYSWLDRRIENAGGPVVVDGYPRVPGALPHFVRLAERLKPRGSVIALHPSCTPDVTASRINSQGEVRRPIGRPRQA